MTISSRLRTIGLSALAIAAAAFAVHPAAAQGQGGTQSGPMREAVQLDLAGNTAQARRILQTLIDSAATPAARAQAQRAMAMSYGFEGDCANALRGGAALSGRRARW